MHRVVADWTNLGLPVGGHVYAGDFSQGALHQVSATDLTTERPALDLEYGPEGLAVSRSEGRLFIIHKYEYLNVVSIPEMELVRSMEPFYGYFIRLVGEDHALIGGQFGDIQLVNRETGEVLRSSPGSWHFDVSPSEDRVAVLHYRDSFEIRLLSLPELTELTVLPLDGVPFADAVAFDPDGSRLYVIGEDSLGERFLAIDLASGDVVRDLRLEGGGCSFYCAANPVAVSSSGRYVFFEQHQSGVLVVDTELDMPLYRAPVTGSVAAAPADDIFYVLRPDGLLSKVAVRP
jgi:DNA-binding beta-propeller fold protein YncE